MDLGLLDIVEVDSEMDLELLDIVEMDLEMLDIVEADSDTVELVFDTVGTETVRL